MTTAEKTAGTPFSVAPLLKNSRFIDLTGRVFGRMTVDSFAGVIGEGRSRATVWNCLCDCGQRCPQIRSRCLMSGGTQSCGCLQREAATIHGHAGGQHDSSTYMTYRSMIKRVFNPKHRAYKYYGGRGITVCDRWVGGTGFQAFLDDMGERPDGTSLDRINVNGNYEPSNCRWATDRQQCRNKRNNKIVEFRGEKMCLTELAEKYGISSNAAQGRLRRGWSLERTLTEPIRRDSRHARKDVQS